MHLVNTLQDADAEFVAQAQRGNLEAFEELVRRDSQLIYRTLVAILGNPTEAQDAAQDTLLSAFQHIGAFQGRAKFSTWLVSIARIRRYNDYDAGKILRAWTRASATGRGIFALVGCEPSETTRNSPFLNRKCGSLWKRGF